ncbi:MAG: CBS domain-containing protein [Anaerolineaceae bacterium]|nr:CBS domain-containing protein [Anaerolineaceae bacterium]
MSELHWLFVVIFLLLDLLLAVMRASLLNARLPLLMNLAENQPEEVERAMTLLANYRIRTTLRLGIVISHFVLAGLTAWGLLQIWPGRVGLALGMMALAALLLVVLEYLMEGAILPHAEKWALRFTPLARLVDVVFSPLSTALTLLLGSPDMLRQRFSPVTEYELRNWVEEGQAEGSLEKGEREMIYSIFHFGDTLAREIMVPRIDLQALEINTPLEEAAQALTGSGHSRVPVYEDTVDNIVGLLYAKDLLRARLEGQSLSALRGMLRPAYFVPEAKKVDDLLSEMQLRRVHMAVVVDEYGGVAGLVTLEDIVEEIVGEIQDEFDQAEEQPYQQVGPDEYIFLGRTDLDDFNDVMGSHIDKDIADTLGGLIYGLLGHVPNGPESVEVDGLQLTVEQVSGRRIRKVRASRPLAQSTEEAKDDAE